MLASDILTSAADELNDLEPGFEHTRWPVDELLRYLTEGIAQLATLKPTLFKTTVVLSLGPGALQHLPEYVESLDDIIFNLDTSGQLAAPVLPGDFNLQRAFGKGACPADVYVVRSFSVHPSTSTVFYVDPPVPSTSPTVKVQAVVQLAPQVVTTISTPITLPNASPLTYRNALKDWVLYRAFAKDSESQSSAERSKAHFQAFYQFFGSPPRNKRAVPMAEAEKRDASRVE